MEEISLIDHLTNQASFYLWERLRFLFAFEAEDVKLASELSFAVELRYSSFTAMFGWYA